MALAAACAFVVTLVMLCGIGIFVALDWGRFALWLAALAGGALAFGALGVAIGALAREVRAASLLAFLLSLPIAFLALVPGRDGGHLALRRRSAPSRRCSRSSPALQAVDAALNGAQPGLGPTLAAPRRPRRRLPGARPRGARALPTDAPSACASKTQPTRSGRPPPRTRPAQLALRQANREHTGPWDPARDESFYTEAGQRLELDLDQRSWAAGSAYAFAVLDADARRPRSSAASRSPTSCAARGRTPTLGYWIDKDALGPRATRRAPCGWRCASPSSTPGLHRVQPAIIPRNARSVAAWPRRRASACEGRALRYLKIAGIWEDHDVYALTVEDWDAHAGAR